jgi:hypothetical protein
MRQHIFVAAVICAALFAPIVNAQEGRDPGQVAAQGFGFALSTQERCAGHPVRSPEADRFLQARVVDAIRKQTGSNIDAVRMGLAAGAMQANFTKKPTKKDCHQADKVVSAAQKM